MVKQVACLALIMGLITGSGCATGESPPTSSRPGPDVPPPPPPPDPDWAKCRKLTKTLNTALISSVRAALKKVSGTPVETMEIIEAGQPVYHVQIVNQRKQIQTVRVEQPAVDAEKLADPSSLHECKTLLNAKSKEERIITAMRLAQQKAPGRLVKAQFGKYEDRFLYTITVEDAKGNSHLVRVDPESRKVINIEPPIESHDKQD